MFSQFFALSFAAILVKAAQFEVTVGGDSLAFTPPFVNAVAGDLVQFTFKQKNHTVTQSTFANPCEMLPGGFDSGFMPVDAANTNGPFPAAQFVVQGTDPVWVYCRQAGHCGKGMVFAINPGEKLEAFKAAAMATSTAATTSAPSASGTLTSSLSVTSTSASSAAATSVTATGTDHKIVVGGASLTFSPSNITAQVGDTITFQFMKKNHTATQSTFANPCRALALTSTTGQVGFDSGFNPVAADATTFPMYTIQVNDTAPIWVYCKQAGHCGQGMVFAANTVESGPNTFAAFQAKAAAMNGTGTGTTPASSSAASATSTTNANSGTQLTSGAGAIVMLGSIILGMLI